MARRYALQEDMSRAREQRQRDLSGYGLAVLVTLITTSLSALLVQHVAQTNLAMVYLLGVTYVANRKGAGPAILASFLGVAAFDFFFVPPGLTFAVSDVEYLFTFAVMLGVSLLISALSTKLNKQSELSQQAALRAQAEQMRADLLSGVSHDLRTPLASIEGSAEALLHQNELSEQSRQLAKTIHTESERMSRFVRNMLDMTRAQGSVDLEVDWYAMDELIANAILRTESMFDLPVQLHTAPGTPLARVDGMLMEQVFVNLLENAVRHAGRKVLVRIELRQENEWLVIDVIDNGPGLPPGMEEAIFERFQGTKGEGFGLGLAVCRAALEAHQGSISARSRQEGGAIFTVKLPIVKEEEVA